MESEFPDSSARRNSNDSQAPSIIAPVTFQKKVSLFLYSAGSFVVMIVRESTSFCALALIITWISYFVTAIDRQTLFILNGVFIGLIIVASLLKRKYMLTELREMDRNERRRRIHRNGFVRSSTNPSTPDDADVILQIRSIYVKNLMTQNVETNISLKDCPVECGTSCVICLVDFEPIEPIVGLECHHYFHPECLTDWLITQVSTTSMEVCPSCPTCRNRLYMCDESMKSFVDEVCAPGFITSRNLSHQVNVVFNQYRQTVMV